MCWKLLKKRMINLQITNVNVNHYLVTNITYALEHLKKLIVYDSENSHFLQRYSWHLCTIDALIELPAEIKQSFICAENKAHKNRVKHETQCSINSIILQKRFSEQPPFHSLTKSYESGTYYVPVKSLLQNLY